MPHQLRNTIFFLSLTDSAGAAAKGTYDTLTGLTALGKERFSAVSEPDERIADSENPPRAGDTQ